jgi:fatty-acyl-CoA synthase
VTAETYGALLQKQAGEHGGTTALIDDERAVTFAELDGRTRRLSAGLAGLGLRRGDVVAVWLPNTIEWAQTALAAGLLGVITLGVNTKLRSHDVQQLLAESGAKVLITYPGFKGIDFLGMLAEIGPALPPSLTHIVHIRSAELQGTDGLASQALVAYEDLFGSVPLEYQASDVAEIPAQAFTSSGSTGRPKIILHDQRGLLFHGHAVAERFGYRAQDAVVFGTLPLCGVFGFNTLLASLAAGRTLVLQAVFNAEEALRLVERHRITHMNLADGMLRMLLDAVGALDDPARISTWREAAFGNFTATDPMEMIQVGGRLGKKFYQTYGSSEVLALMTYPAQGSTPERWALGGGEPVSEAIEVRVRDAETGEPAGLGAHGEIEVRGPNVSLGLLTAEGIKPHPPGEDGFFGTGDLGYLRSERDVVYLARMGDAVRLGGFLVSPREVEAFLGAIPGVHEAQYIAVGGSRGLVPVAFVIPEDNCEVSEGDVISACQGKLAAFKVPQRVLIVDCFPTLRSANGDKVQRNRLREIAHAEMYGEQQKDGVTV